MAMFISAILLHWLLALFSFFTVACQSPKPKPLTLLLPCCHQQLIVDCGLTFLLLQPLSWLSLHMCITAAALFIVAFCCQLFFKGFDPPHQHPGKIWKAP